MFNTMGIKGKINRDTLLKGTFGLEREGLRVNSNGKLALTPHPEIFGDKIENKYVTTDFSESQLEVITPIENSPEEVYETLKALNDIVISNLNDDEYLWNQSMPCILPSSDKIPIAEYNNSDKGIDAMEYRKDLLKRYGPEKQMISGIHYNFAFTNTLIEELHNILGEDLSFKEFKNQIYLKIVRNYLRYYGLIIYLTGSTVNVDKSFNHEINTENLISIRNGSLGYKNLKSLYPNYTSIENFALDIDKFISEGSLSSLKELYAPIRFKAKKNDNNLDTLLNEGIEYVEIRTIDINPFERVGVNLDDVKFLHLFLLYLIFKEESDYKDWQDEGFKNAELIADNGFKKDLTLTFNGENITFKEWALELFAGLEEFNNTLNLGMDDLISLMKDKVLNPSKTYAYKLSKLIDTKGYVKAHTDFLVENKNESISNFQNKTSLICKYEELLLNK